MKKLAILIFAILILGCGTEKPVVEEPEPIEPPPVVMEHEPTGHPLVAQSNVKNGEVNVDPAPLNRTGFYFKFTEHFYMYQVRLYDKDGMHLIWGSRLAGEWERRDFLWIVPMSDDLLEYDTEYEIVISAQNYDCDFTEIVIQLRTKPRRPGVEKTPTVMEKHTPVVASGERFRLEPAVPDLIGGDVFWGVGNVDPEPLNENGINLQFDEPVKKYKVDLRLHKGASLNWLPHGLVENNLGIHIQITPAEGAPLLELDTAYEIDIFVEDFQCSTNELDIVFHTKPKP